MVEIYDQIPVDGGITITITTRVGGTEYLLFPSLFTNPPPSQEVLNLYEVVRRVELGDWVRAEGKRTTAGVELETLSIWPVGRSALPANYRMQQAVRPVSSVAEQRPRPAVPQLTQGR